MILNDELLVDPTILRSSVTASVALSPEPLAKIDQNDQLVIITTPSSSSTAGTITTSSSSLLAFDLLSTPLTNEQHAFINTNEIQPIPTPGFNIMFDYD